MKLGEPPDPAPPRRLRLRVRGHVRARRAGSRACTRAARAARVRASTRRRSSTRGRAGRSSTAPASSSRSASRRRRSTRTRGRSRDPQAIAAAAAQDARLDPEQVLRRARRPVARLRLRRAQGRPGAGGDARRGAASSGLGFYARGAARLPARPRSPRRCSATRASTTAASPGSSSRSTRVLPGKPGSETVIRRPVGPRDRRPRLDARRARARRHAHARPHDPGAGRGRAARRRSTSGARRRATAIVLDPRTGDILAMAIAPGYDANRFPIVPKDRQRNRAVTDTYEPGSTFKVVTVARVLSERLVTPADRVHAARTRSTSPTASSTTRTRGDRDG